MSPIFESLFAQYATYEPLDVTLEITGVVFGLLMNLHQQLTIGNKCVNVHLLVIDVFPYYHLKSNLAFCFFAPILKCFQ